MEEELDFEDEKCIHEDDEEKEEMGKEGLEKGRKAKSKSEDNADEGKISDDDDDDDDDEEEEEEGQEIDVAEQEIKEPPEDGDGEEGDDTDKGEEDELGENADVVKNGPNAAVSAEEGEDDDGEIVDDELEEGEVKDTTSFTQEKQQKQVCRFFNRYQCTWGNMCKFLHISYNEHGNYHMFEPSPKVVPSYAMAMPPPPMPLRHNVPEYIPPPLPPIPPPPIPVPEPAPVESAWERGLRQARELVQKSLRRKQQEPDFEEKRMNLTLKEREQERSPDEFEEKEFPVKLQVRHPDVKRGSPEEEDLEEVDERWGGGHYENFEIRARTDVREERRGDRERNRNFPRAPPEQERPKQKPFRNWKDERITELETRRSRADEWRDPWRRSKSPKGRSRSRNRSRSSYSSISSRSYSGSRSSPSYRSYSRSGSRSSRESRRRSYSTRSRSFTGTPSRSRSRSYSRSLSMDSVSSASSSISRSSDRSGSLQTRNTLGSVLYKHAGTSSNRNGVGARSPARKSDSKHHKPEGPEFGEKQRAAALAKKSGGEDDMWGRKLLPDNMPPCVPSGGPAVVPALNSVADIKLPPHRPTQKDSSKQYTPKPQIKLTLLNKQALPAKIPNPLKKDPEPAKAKVEKGEKSNAAADKKQPPVVPGAKVTGAAVKRSTSSRRDELLKQLKAVEDAIARKRSKC